MVQSDSQVAGKGGYLHYPLGRNRANLLNPDHDDWLMPWLVPPLSTTTAIDRTSFESPFYSEAQAPKPILDPLDEGIMHIRPPCLLFYYDILTEDNECVFLNRKLVSAAN